jgi:MFS family permease
MSKSETLATRYFLNHFLAASSNAFFDVLLKNGITVYAAFRADMTAENVAMVAALSWTLFILPFFIFSAHGGYLGDRYDKRKVSMSLRAIDICLAALTAFGFVSGNIVLLLALVFAKGVTTTLYSPLKYAMLSEFLPYSTLATGSSLIEAGTMVAILSGSYAGAIYGADADTFRIGAIAITVAIVSLLATWFGPRSKEGDPGRLAPSINPLKSTFEILRSAYQVPHCIVAIVALSWYWALGSVYLSNVTVLVRTVLLGDEKLVASILLILTLGISCGLAAGSYYLRGKPNPRVAVSMALTVGLAGIDLYAAIPGSLLRMQFDFFTFALATGVYAAHFSSVLYLTVNQQTKAHIFVAYNIISSLLAVLALLINTYIVGHGISLPLCLAGFAFATVPLALTANRMIRKHS